MLDAATDVFRAPSAPVRCPHGVLADRFCASCHVACGTCGGDSHRTGAACPECNGLGAATCVCCCERMATHACVEDGGLPWCDECEIEAAEACEAVTEIRPVVAPPSEHGANADGTMLHADCRLCRACRGWTRAS